MGHSCQRLVKPLDHGGRGPAMPPYMASEKTNSLPHMDGIKGPQTHMGSRDHGFTSQDARIVDRAEF